MLRINKHTMVLEKQTQADNKMSGQKTNILLKVKKKNYKSYLNTAEAGSHPEKR